MRETVESLNSKNRPLLALHKVVAVEILVLLGTPSHGANKISSLGTSMWLIISLAVLAFIAMIASSGVLRVVEAPQASYSDQSSSRQPKTS